MSTPSSVPLGGPTPVSRILGPALDKIIKNASWRKNSALVSSCKSSLDLLHSLNNADASAADADTSSSPLAGLPSSTAASVLSPLPLALDPSSPKLIDPALDCLFRLLSLRLLRGPVDSSSSSILSRLLDGVCSLAGGDDSMDLPVLRVLLAFVRCPSLHLHGDPLVQILKSCYNVYLGGSSASNQVVARVVLAQIVAIVVARVDADSLSVPVRAVSIADMLDHSDRNLNDSILVQAAQAFIDEAMTDGTQSNDVGDGASVSEEAVSWQGQGQGGGGGELSKIREDGIFLFKNLCKFSMKFAVQENGEDPMMLRGKLLSLELLKMVVENAGTVWRTDERFLGAIKQYLCLSLLKNSALSAMSIFQLLCSIFLCLLSRFRSGLKGEIGIFFPMLVLRVLENVLQPSFLQKMTVLSLLEKICQDPQIMVDIFVNYDCDVEAPNIFERIVNGLLKTALGVPPGSSTTLSPIQDITFRIESVKCLTAIIKSMGAWMDQQLRIEDFSPRSPEFDQSRDSQSAVNGEEGAGIEFDDANPELSNAATLEQRRAYKLEFQKGISLFNRKPSKGIEFLIKSKKIGGSPEEVASFLKNTTGLNETMIGDYLGEREEFPLKVMHAYVDSLDFEGMDFGESIRFFLRGFRLPGEAQKIDRIMEKFAERFCKCNPSSFTSADTAYVLAYSVIMLNTDAHNNMVKDKMSKADFIRNNRGIDDGKDLPEDYLGSLYDKIVKNEIKMKADSSTPQNKQASSINKLLGLDNIFNLVNWKQAEDKALGASDMLIKHIQEQFKAKSSKSESVYYTVTDTAILRYMMEACWAPMMAAFSVTLDQSDDKAATSQCLLGFRYAVHVTSVMCMQTQRDAFVTSVAKFTYLHCAADMKQKNVDAVKTIISIAIEDGNHLQDSWEHVLTCLSRFEHLHLLGEGAPTDASFFTVSLAESEEKSQKSIAISSLKRKGNALQIPAVMAVVRGGSYDSASIGVNASGLVSSEQINNFISNLNLLDQIGTSELNHIFAHSQRLNGDAIVAFVKALCKVSMTELQSPTDPRVFSLTKIVEIAHYNMNRIRLVWSRIWNVLADFFVSVGLSENLSVAIFVMDSLRQLAMKFLEREELANYNFQNEFLRPFAIVMQKSNCSEIRELIVRCVSQMVLSRVNNVKSGWKSVFMVFTIAAADERKNIVLLAFETMEKIVRDYFPYITETETTTFTDCVKCLITFTNSRFNSDASLNAIAFLRFCAVKLAEGGVVCYNKDNETHSVNGDASEENTSAYKDDHVYFWVPLLAGLSKLTSDSRPTISKGALEVLFDILKDHGHLFSSSFWNNIFKSVIYPIFNKEQNIHDQITQADSSELAEDSWSSETHAVAAQCLVDLFVNFFDVMRSQLANVVEILIGFIRTPYQQSANIGVTALLNLTGKLGSSLSETEWREVLLPLQKAVILTQPLFSRIVRIMHNVEMPERSQTYSDTDQYSEHEFVDEEEDANMETASYAVVRIKGHIALQLLIIQAVMKLYELHQKSFSAAHVSILLDIFSSISSHANEVIAETTLHQKLQKACSLLEISDPPLVHFENESYQNYLKFLQALLKDNPSISEELKIESQLVAVCVKILQIYLNCAGCQRKQQSPSNSPTLHWRLPLNSTKKEELAARTALIVLAIKVLSSLDSITFRRNLPCFFPLLVDLIRCEHSSGEVQRVLYNMFRSLIGPVVLTL
ncbi:brefeldin A-inhibited guanine nucleotide-exchange protein 1-like [Iris pallida]|uniref:Brefeldin A-inhibited guanine nucleotide-exchange protein 1-like n=1 Tax=Iris pallida TaxID=29817 RepID=A0AAX6H5S4_IRIPA|nr:brefeldin A-inhibited guanine nucleotide-exchange protein 1-like [Iris pallida]